jgi:hypothetical protein
MTAADTFEDGARVKVTCGALAGRVGIVALDGEPPEGTVALVRIRIEGAIPPHWWVHPIWLEPAT